MEPTKKRKRKIQKPYTPLSFIKNALRQLWLRSRERRAALSRDGYTCVDCHGKQSKAKGREFKVEVDHLDGCDIGQIAEYVRRHLLHPPERLETVCKEDHEKRTAIRKEIEGKPTTVA